MLTPSGLPGEQFEGHCKGSRWEHRQDGTGVPPSALSVVVEVAVDMGSLREDACPRRFIPSLLNNFSLPAGGLGYFRACQPA